MAYLDFRKLLPEEPLNAQELKEAVLKWVKDSNTPLSPLAKEMLPKTWNGEKQQSEWGAAWQTLLLILEEMPPHDRQEKEGSLLEDLEKLKKEKE